MPTCTRNRFGNTIDYWLFCAEGLHPTHLPGPCGNHGGCVARRVAANVRTIRRGLFRRAPDAVNDTLVRKGVTAPSLVPSAATSILLFC